MPSTSGGYQWEGRDRSECGWRFLGGSSLLFHVAIGSERGFSHWSSTGRPRWPPRSEPHSLPTHGGTLSGVYQSLASKTLVLLDRCFSVKLRGKKLQSLNGTQAKINQAFLLYEILKGSACLGF